MLYNNQAGYTFMHINKGENMKKLALLVGVNEYAEGLLPLTSAVNDAKNLSKKLVELGFDVVLEENIKYLDFAAAVEKFSEIASSYDVGMFFYAGHGFQYDNSNYLTGVDTTGDYEMQMKYMSIPLDDIIKAMEKSSLRVKIIMIDACRNILLNNTRGMSSDFAPVFAPKGTIIGFATSPGQKAKENKNHGVYTNAVLQHIGTPKISIEEMFKRVRNTVSSVTNEQQISWEHTSLMGDFSFYNKEIGNSVFDFSKEALADSLYVAKRGSEIGLIINDLKSNDWNIQSPAINRITRSLLLDSDADELLVLGRNIYQCSNHAYSARDFVRDFKTNFARFNLEDSEFILTGMIYELYFDSNGKLRTFFKLTEENLHESLFNLLLQNKFINALSFIQIQLLGYDSRIVYIPGIDYKYVFELFLEKNTKNELIVTRLCSNGLDLLYDEYEDKLIDVNTVYYMVDGTIIDFESLVKKYTLLQSCDVTFVYHSVEKIDADTKINFINRFRILKYV